MIHIKQPFVATGFALGLVLVAGSAYADASQTVIDQCNIQVVLDKPEKCDCMGNMARTELTEQQQELAAARMTDDAEATGSLESDMSAEDVSAVDQWLVDTPATCEQP